MLLRAGLPGQRAPGQRRAYCFVAGLGESPFGADGESGVTASGMPCWRGFLLRCVVPLFFLSRVSLPVMAEPVELVDPLCIVESLPLMLPPVADGVVLRLAGGLPSVGGALGFGALLLGGACWATAGRLSAAHSASAVVVTIRFIVGSIH
ncbi:hypothetical protein N6G06_22135 [Cupriavidus gilardii]|uniref:hypothetical protein n=1 Tax=Cupriavidus gilardii TaxID=82541 RepID=UPI0021BE3FFA|nr:hypothetical protein [Cupriavidus gilardii]MCT9074063.1 hypothetical protein [Cupriavidus gilardii]